MNRYNSSNDYKTHDNFVRVLAYYGYYPTKQNNSYKIYKCPNCNKDAYVKANKITLTCNHRNTCNYHVNMFDFIIQQESCSFIDAKDKAREILQDNRYTDIKDICKAAVATKECVKKEVKDEKEGKKIIKLFNYLLRTAKYKDVLDYIMNVRQLQHIPFDRLFIGAYEKYYKDNNDKWQKAHFLVMPNQAYPLSLNLRCVNSEVIKDHRYASSIKYNNELYKVHQTSTILYFKDKQALKCVIAEGYIDMLSVMECNITDLKKQLCYISLNSVSNHYKLTERLENIGYIAKEKEYLILLDNDKTGRESAEKLYKSMLDKGYKVTNITDTFYNTDCKDLNEMLVKDRVNLVNRLKAFI